MDAQFKIHSKSGYRFFQIHKNGYRIEIIYGAELDVMNEEDEDANADMQKTFCMSAFGSRCRAFVTMRI